MIGTAFVAATLLASDVMPDRASDDSVTAAFAEADLVVDGRRRRLSSTRSGDVPGVEVVDPVLAGGVEVRKGASRSWQILMPVASDPSLSSQTLADGSAPPADDEIALPRDVAERLGRRAWVALSSSPWTEWPDNAEPITDAVDATVTGLTTDPGGAWTGVRRGEPSRSATQRVRWANLDAEPLGTEGALIKAYPRHRPRSTRRCAPSSRAATADRQDVPAVEAMTRDQAGRGPDRGDRRRRQRSVVPGPRVRARSP